MNIFCYKCHPLSKEFTYCWEVLSAAMQQWQNLFLHVLRSLAGWNLVPKFFWFRFRDFVGWFCGRDHFHHWNYSWRNHKVQSSGKDFCLWLGELSVRYSKFLTQFSVSLAFACFPVSLTGLWFQQSVSCCWNYKGIDGLPVNVFYYRVLDLICWTKLAFSVKHISCRNVVWYVVIFFVRYVLFCYSCLKALIPHGGQRTNKLTRAIKTALM